MIFLNKIVHCQEYSTYSMHIQTMQGTQITCEIPIKYSKKTTVKYLNCLINNLCQTRHEVREWFGKKYCSNIRLEKVQFNVSSDHKKNLFQLFKSTVTYYRGLYYYFVGGNLDNEVKKEFACMLKLFHQESNRQNRHARKLNQFIISSRPFPRNLKFTKCFFD